MKQLIIRSLILLSLGFSSLNATNGQNYYRYGDIDTKLSKRAILVIAKQELRRLVIQKKIPTSWKSLPESKIEKNHRTNSGSWIVSFNNPKIKKKKRKTLNILVSASGNIIGAGYTH